MAVPEGSGDFTAVQGDRLQPVSAMVLEMTQLGHQAGFDDSAQRIRFMDWLPEAVISLMHEGRQDDKFRQLRRILLQRRDAAITACCIEIVISLLSVALYDLRRSFLILVVNGVLTVLSCVGLYGALTLSATSIRAHGIVTTGLIIACLLNFVAEALLTSTGIGSDTMPSWVVLVLLLVPYSLNLACSVVSLVLSTALDDFSSREEETSGLVGEDVLERQAEELRGRDLCCVCMTRAKDAVLTPCGHRATCHPCGDALRARSRLCPLCRRQIGTVQRVYE